MRERFGAAVVLALATLALAGPAQAKEISALKVCGAGGCTSVRDRTVLTSLTRGIRAQLQAAHVSTPSPAPFLRLEYWVRGDRSGEPSFVQYYVPSKGVAAVMTGPDSWSWVRPDSVGAIVKRVTRAVSPYSTPHISSVTIGGKAVRDPSSYVRLFAVRGKAENLPDKPDWQRIVVKTRDPSPWSTSAATLEYSKSTNVLWRGNEFVQVPSMIAARLEARGSLLGRIRAH